MNVKYIIDHIPRNTPYNRRPGLPLSPEFITVHSTGNPGSTARQERAWLTNPANGRTASWHICVDEKEAVEAIPPGEVAWHAGDGASGPGNRKSIAIEICESSNRERTLENAVELVAGFLQERNWGIDRLRRHFDWSGKACPRILMADDWAGWEDFKSGVQKHLNALKSLLDRVNPVTPLNPVDPAGPASPVNPAGSLIGAGQNPADDPAATTKAADAADPAGPEPPADFTGPELSTKPTVNPGDAPLPQIQRRIEGTLNGRPVDFEAYLIDNAAFVPLRPLAAALGFVVPGLQIKWADEKYHIITTTDGGNK